MKRNRWQLKPALSDKNLVSASGLPPLLVQLLYNRGVTEVSQFKSFLSVDISLSHDPFLFPDMHRAVTRIYRALLSGEHIAVYGDFDTDGITGTALLVSGLASIGGKVTPYIPHRQTEGHGLRKAVLQDLAKQGVSLVITNDCGTTNQDEVKQAQKLGMDVIITDHHTPGPELPPAFAHINPKLDISSYPFRHLAGAGVAFKLLQALFQSLGKESAGNEFLDLVALGTIADMSPLTGENRFFAVEGLKLINVKPRPGIRAILNQANVPAGSVIAEHISWIISPYLNATGRLEHAMSSYRLLMTESLTEASKLAELLAQKNEERKRLTATTFAKAREQVLAKGMAPLIFVSSAEFPIGVAGLVAHRLTEEFYRPSVVIELGEKMSSGSCRSIPEFDIIANLNRCHSLFTQFGGHSQAAGFTIPTRNVPRLEAMLAELAASQLAGIELLPRIDIDAELTLHQLGGNTYQITQQLAPFGQANPPPTFIARRVDVVQCRTMGNTNNHLRLKLRQNNSVWDGVAFGLGNHCAEVASPLDIVFNLEIDRWNGKELLRLNILDFAQHRQEPF